MRARTALLSLSLLALSGCGNKVDGASDDQLTALFADRTPMSRTETEEPRITRRTLDCVRLIGGLDDAVYKDAPAELMGALRTDCRRGLQERLSDPARNPTGIALADLESSKAGERVTALHGRLEQVDSLMGEIGSACAENGAAREQAVAANTRNRYRWSLPYPCGEANLRSIRAQTDRVRTELGRIAPDAATRPGALFALPQLYGNDPKELQGRLAQIKAQTAEMRAAP